MLDDGRGTWHVASRDRKHVNLLCRQRILWLPELSFETLSISCPVHSAAWSRGGVYAEVFSQI